MKKCQGQSLVQFIIIMPLFFVLLFGLFEMTYIYRAKATLNTATFEAARAGALNHAELEDMKSALANGMLAQYVKGSTGVADIALAALEAGVLEKLFSLRESTITVISPTKAMFDKFKTKRMYRLNDESKETLQDILPNDNLNFRFTTAEEFDIGGETRKINIQDANLLKIKSYWCYELKVPFLRSMIQSLGTGSFLGDAPSSEQQACSLVALARGTSYLAISSHAVIRMQSPVSYKATLAN